MGIAEMLKLRKTSGSSKIVRKLTAGLLMVVLIAGMLTLGGCGKKEIPTLEEMVSENPKVGNKIEKNLEEFRAEGISPSLSYSKNTIKLTLKFDETFDKGEVKDLSKAFEKNGDAYKSACDKAIEQIKKDTELKRVKIRITVLNGNSAEMWTRLYEAEKPASEDESAESTDKSQDSSETKAADDKE